MRTISLPYHHFSSPSDGSTPTHGRGEGPHLRSLVRVMAGLRRAPPRPPGHQLRPRTPTRSDPDPAVWLTHPLRLSRTINRARSSRRHIPSPNGQPAGTVGLTPNSSGSTPASASAHLGRRAVTRRYRQIDTAMPRPTAEMVSA